MKFEIDSEGLTACIGFLALVACVVFVITQVKGCVLQQTQMEIQAKGCGPVAPAKAAK